MGTYHPRRRMYMILLPLLTQLNTMMSKDNAMLVVVVVVVLYILCSSGKNGATLNSESYTLCI